MEKITEKDPVWKQNGTQFVESVTKLLERLLDYRSVMQVMNLIAISFMPIKKVSVEQLFIQKITDRVTFKATIHFKY